MSTPRPSNPHWRQRRWFVGEIEDMKTVLSICQRWGWGNVMQVIADAWAEKDPSGALTVGPCRAYAPPRKQDTL